MRVMAKSYVVTYCCVQSRHIISQSVVHNTTSSDHITWYIDRAIQIPFLRAKWDNFQALQIVNFSQ